VVENTPLVLIDLGLIFEDQILLVLRKKRVIEDGGGLPRVVEYTKMKNRKTHCFESVKWNWVYVTFQ